MLDLKAFLKCTKQKCPNIKDYKYAYAKCVYIKHFTFLIQKLFFLAILT